MKLMEAYELAVRIGIEHDIRPKKEIESLLLREKETYDSLDERGKGLFDRERLWNPYYDTRFSWGDKELEAECMMWGIDIETGEVLLADRLREKGRKISAVVAHHPTGTSKVPFPQVVQVQKDLYSSYGVPINVLDGMMDQRTQEVTRGVHPSNYNQAVDAAKLLGIPIMNIHMPADNCVQYYLSKVMEKASPQYMEEIIDVLMDIPEFQVSARYNCPPKIIVGGPKDHCGKVMCKMNGGTSSPKEVYEKLESAGIGTVIGMHFPENHIEEARKHNIRLVVSGHMASDSLGVNIICDEWERNGIEVLPCSGLIRVKRN